MDTAAFAPLLAETVRVCLDPRAVDVQAAELPFSFTGYSGAWMRLFAVEYRGGDGAERAAHMLVKAAGRIERRTSVLLSRQGHAALPFAYAADLNMEAPAPLCVEYLQPDSGPGEEFAQRAAEALAEIHFRNLGDRGMLGWAPPADGGYFSGGYVLETWRRAWQERLTDADFAREYGARQDALEAAAVDFLAQMEALWREGATLTLIHGDLHDGNALVSAGRPYFIDWAHAHYGSFYLDLPNLFTLAEAEFYRSRMAQLGLEIAAPEFAARYRQAARHVGFKYMAFTLSGWAGRDQTGSQVRAHLDNLIHLAVHGG